MARTRALASANRLKAGSLARRSAGAGSSAGGACDGGRPRQQRQQLVGRGKDFAAQGSGGGKDAKQQSAFDQRFARAGVVAVDQKAAQLVAAGARGVQHGAFVVGQRRRAARSR